MKVTSRIQDIEPVKPFFCDAVLADGLRVEFLEGQIGQWPDSLELESLKVLAESLNWHQDLEELQLRAAVVQEISDRAKIQDFEKKVELYLHHLQHVCQKPRLHLRVEQERLPVSRARRVPVRAVAELVARPGDWESRSFSSVRPKRILSRVSEDEWNLYENRVAARLVDRLLDFFGRRVEELRRIDRALRDKQRDHREQANSWHRRSYRVMEIWGEAIENGVEDTVRETLGRVEKIHRALQMLLESPLYREIPRGASVPTALKSTNILVNDKHYRRVAHLWREWVKHGYRRQLTKAELVRQKQEQGKAWDGFIYHLVLRALSNNLQGKLIPGENQLELCREGYLPLTLRRDALGVVELRQAKSRLRLVPVCAAFKGISPEAMRMALDKLTTDPECETVVMHNGGFEDAAETQGIDSMQGWSFNGSPTLFGCSPWAIDSEERVARLLNGWMNRVALPEYPPVSKIYKLPELPKNLDWIERRGDFLMVLKGPRPDQMTQLRDWCSRESSRLKNSESKAKLAKQPFDPAPLNALRDFTNLLDRAETDLAHLSSCPICRASGKVIPRPGKSDDGSDTSWWASCACGAEWGLRSCSSCHKKYRVLIPDKKSYSTENKKWPDDIYGRDVWAQPCQNKPEQSRCAHCGSCPGGPCERCVLSS